VKGGKKETTNSGKKKISQRDHKTYGQKEGERKSSKGGTCKKTCVYFKKRDGFYH